MGIAADEHTYTKLSTEHLCRNVWMDQVPKWLNGNNN